MSDVCPKCSAEIGFQDKLELVNGRVLKCRKCGVTAIDSQFLEDTFFNESKKEDEMMEYKSEYVVLMRSEDEKGVFGINVVGILGPYVEAIFQPILSEVNFDSKISFLEKVKSLMEDQESLLASIVVAMDANKEWLFKKLKVKQLMNEITVNINELNRKD